ncbi:ParB/RepB/Spo0J family partition protein [Paragemmobacter straminiformis]|uniref:ParB/RepB/Spo0J family partition protein n=1 Tax=Paragemmobacter straminiformis TaxID=2045119 RepID=A0A842I8S5_9RHOB|nr:ParB/RepB/Spo0J family partition protein [Gemmobacter straminiformis]MBC2836045.1 ParB/RepB/Spo0J family partition protein [Gemmobacter straminiformis]
MEKKNERRGLGRGLSALMADVSVEVDPQTPDRARRPDLLVPVERLVPNPNQPRRDFQPEALQELADSIRLKGVIQPLIVRLIAEDRYEIVAGERRWRAAQLAQVHELPVILRDFSDSEVIEVAIIENIQRADLNAVEEALAYKQLMERFGHTQEKVAEALSKSRSHIANLLRLLTLPEDVQAYVRQGKLSAGHARALITSPRASELARQVIERNLSVRETEALAKHPEQKGAGKSSGPRPKGEKDADTRALEGDLSASLGMRVVIDHSAGGEGGSLTVHYRTLDDLDMLCAALSVARRDLAI